jgi:hypothetical protein
MKFSVIIPTYNRYDLLLKCIESVKSQTYKDLEIIVINDCSDDNRYDNLKNSVCIHIRRSDYLEYTDIYHIQELSYYTKAIEYLRKISNNNVYLFFTDDPIWVKENFKIDNLTSFISSTNNVINDFIEMSNCNNFIIANSTFSFWAAQFSNNSNKIIIYPKLWFKNVEKNNILINNIIPDNWISF